MIATCVRNASDSTDLKAVLNEKVPKEQERVKNFRKQHGNTKVGEVTVDMVSPNKPIRPHITSHGASQPLKIEPDAGWTIGPNRGEAVQIMTPIIIFFFWHTALGNKLLTCR